MGQPQVAGAEGGEHVFGVLQVGLFRHLVEIHRWQVEPAEFPLQQRLAGRDVLVARLQLEPVNDLRPRARGGDVAQVGVQPVAARRALLAGDDFHLLAGLQAVVERHDAPVDLGSAAVMADLGVHAVGEVQRRGALGQVDGVAVRGEHIDPVGLDIDPELVGQAADVAQLLVPFEHLAQPGDLLLVMIGAGIDVGALVAPVRAHPQFGLLVHGQGANLHLQHLAFGTQHRRVQRAVAVLLGIGDVVVEFLGDVSPQRMHDAERGIAIAHFRHQHAHGANVVDLAELQALLLHLPPDRIDVLGATVDLRLDAGGGQLVAQLLHHVVDVLLAIQAPLMQQLGDLLVLFGFEVAEGQVLQLPLDMADAQPVGQRRVDIEHLARHPVALVVIGILHRADGAGALGQLDQRDTHVVNHGHQHLAQIFHLGLAAQHQGLARIETGADGRHAQHTLDQLGHHRTETLMHVGELHLAFTHAAIDHRGDQAVLVELEVGEDFGDLEPGLVAGRALAPEVLRGVGLLLHIAGELAGFPECLAVERRVHAQHVIEPAIEIDAAVGVDRLKSSDLDHLITFLLRSNCVAYADILCAGRLIHGRFARQE